MVLCGVQPRGIISSTKDMQTAEFCSVWVTLAVLLQCCMLLLLSDISTATCLATAVVGKCRIMHSNVGQCAYSVCLQHQTV